MNGDKSLIHVLPSNSWGGVERYVFDICRHFKSEGWNVTVITRGAKVVDSMFEKEGLTLRCAPFRGLFDFPSVSILIDAIREAADSDVILHVHGFRKAISALLAKRLSRRNDVKVIMTRHKVKRGIDSWLLHKAYEKMDAIIFVSNLAKERFLSTWYSLLLPFKSTDLYVIHNSLNIPEPDYHERKKTGLVIAMFHGPLRPGKGLEVLIDALAMIRKEKFRLRIVGAGKPDYVDELRRRAIKQGVMEMIDWHRHIDNPLQLIEDCDFGILPSQTEEAFGLSNIEYMASGRPQIATSNGAQSEYITDGREGFLIPPGDSKILAETIRKMIGNPELRTKMGEKAIQTFRENLSWNKFIKRLAPVYLS